jgi:hypothetical protein
VEGIVKLDGKPAAHLRVQFIPDPAKGTPGPISGGSTDDNGRFKLMCFDQRTGAVVGFHRVVITDITANVIHTPRTERRENDDRAISFVKTKGPPRKIASKFGNATSTPLEAQVKPQKQEIVIDLNKGTVSHVS